VRLAFLAIGNAALGAVVAALVAGAAAGGSTVITHAGISVSLPSGWRVLDERLTPCVNPVERLVATGNGALVMVQEGLRPLFTARDFDPRPLHFALRGKPSPLECCAPARRAGWLFIFRDHGRGFYVYVYLGHPGTRAQTIEILNRLRVKRVSS
jgi:hypothetical protein